MRLKELILFLDLQISYIVSSSVTQYDSSANHLYPLPCSRVTYKYPVPSLNIDIRDQDFSLNTATKLSVV